MSPLQFLRDLTDPDLSFLPLALATTVLLGVLCGVVGCYVVLRGMAFIGDAVAHAVFPGLAVAFVLSGNLLLGGAVAALLTAGGIAVLAQNRRLREDSVIGVLFVGAFALGIVVVSRAPGYSGSLQQLLLGSVTGLRVSDLAVVAGITVASLALVQALHPRLVATILDRETARALGLPVAALDLVLHLLVAVAVVVAVQTVGNVLVLALLVTPAATARLLTERLVPMMVTAAGIGAACALLGVYLAWSLDSPVGATIVLLATAVFVLAWLLAPRHGLLGTRRAAASVASSVAAPPAQTPTASSSANWVR